MSSLTWLYLRLYPSSLTSVGPALAGTVREILKEAAPAQWFFIRYVDRTGSHLRLRLRATPDVADQVVASRDRWVSTLRRDSLVRCDSDFWHPLIHTSAMADRVQAIVRPRVEVDFYCRETVKWGDLTSAVRAEAAFQQGSELALALQPEAQMAWPTKHDLGIAVLEAAMAAVGLDGERRHAFLVQHHRWWSGGQPLPDLTLKVSDTAVDLWHNRLFASSAPGTPWLRAVEDHVANCGSKGPAMVLFHHIHFMFNRLGVLPIEEGLCSGRLISRNAGRAMT